MIIGPAGKLVVGSASNAANVIDRSAVPSSDTLYEGAFLRAELIFPPVRITLKDREFF